MRRSAREALLRWRCHRRRRDRNSGRQRDRFVRARQSPSIAARTLRRQWSSPAAEGAAPTITVSSPLTLAHAAGAEVSGTGITLTAALSQAHASGAQVVSRAPFTPVRPTTITGALIEGAGGTEPGDIRRQLEVLESRTPQLGAKVRAKDAALRPTSAFNFFRASVNGAARRHACQWPTTQRRRAVIRHRYQWLSATLTTCSRWNGGHVPFEGNEASDESPEFHERGGWRSDRRDRPEPICPILPNQKGRSYRCRALPSIESKLTA